MNRKQKLSSLIESQNISLAASKEDTHANLALCFLEQALADLRKGDYSGFLCSTDLAGEWAQKARQSYYRRVTV